MGSESFLLDFIRHLHRYRAVFGFQGGEIRVRATIDLRYQHVTNRAGSPHVRRD